MCWKCNTVATYHLVLHTPYYNRDDGKTYALTYNKMPVELARYWSGSDGTSHYYKSCSRCLTSPQYREVFEHRPNGWLENVK